MTARKALYWFSRLALATIYIWFGALKVLHQSPANPLVEKLLNTTMPGVSFTQFIIAFGILEIIIGILFLIPRFEKLVLILFVLHMITTALPLYFLAPMVWQRTLIPTLEGQYIIKNLALIAVVFYLVVHRYDF
jgi:uncharacterized membrane protein YkgB